MSSRILIVDDEIDIQSSLSFALKDEGYDVLTASSPAEALALLETQSVDLALYDIWFPEGDGIELLKSSRKLYPSLLPVMMSGHGTIELALNSVRLGAYDFLEKPLELDKVLLVIKNALEIKELRDENERLMKLNFDKGQILGKSSQIEKLKSDVQKAALAQSSVLIRGQNGTGKTLVARTLHQLGKAPKDPFLVVNCLAFSEKELEAELWGNSQSAPPKEGRISMVKRGTLVLDEVSALSQGTQAKLLEFLKTKKYTKAGGKEATFFGNFVALSRTPLEESVKDSKFLEELWQMIKVVTLKVPPLKDRREDILLLAEYYIQSIAKDYSKTPPPLSPELKDWMLEYEWPGNVRELKNLIERMLILKEGEGALGIGDLPEELQFAQTDGSHLLNIEQIKDPLGTLRHLRSQFEKTILEQRLDKMGGNVTKTAESLGIERAHLHRKLKQYGLQAHRGS